MSQIACVPTTAETGWANDTPSSFLRRLLVPAFFVRFQAVVVAKGIKHALTGYIESTLVTGSKLLEGVGVSEADIGELVKDFQKDNYALIRNVYAKVAKT